MDVTDEQEIVGPKPSPTVNLRRDDPLSLQPRARKIAVIDDSITNLTTLRLMLSRAISCEVSTYDRIDTDAMLNLIDSMDLILIDQNMPSFTGLSLIEKICAQQNPAKPSMVLMSASNDPELRAQAIAAGATDFLAKPIDPTDLRELVHRLIGPRS
ncbi:MAG: response regulator [Proteobacteria bacterium]|nr:response regulator [Pseudomonadota bacterium]